MERCVGRGRFRCGEGDELGRWYPGFDEQGPLVITVVAEHDAVGVGVLVVTEERVVFPLAQFAEAEALGVVNTRAGRYVGLGLDDPLR